MDLELQEEVNFSEEERNLEGGEGEEQELNEDVSSRSIEIEEEHELKEKIKGEIEAVNEANVYLMEEFEGKSLRKRFQIINKNWFCSAINIKHVKHVLTLLAFYKFLFLFVTRKLSFDK